MYFSTIISTLFCEAKIVASLFMVVGLVGGAVLACSTSSGIATGEELLEFIIFSAFEHISCIEKFANPLAQ